MSQEGAEALGANGSSRAGNGAGDIVYGFGVRGPEELARMNRVADAVRAMGPDDTLLGVLQGVDAAAAEEHATTIRMGLQREVAERVMAFTAQVTGDLLTANGLVEVKPMATTQPPSHLPAL